MSDKKKRVVRLYDYQMEAIRKMEPGCILKGNVGSGKTLTSLFYFKLEHEGAPLYVITTAKKRSTGDWEHEAELAGVSKDLVAVDSWNNILKYKDVKDSFFIFDENHAISYGTWGKTMIHIARHNKFILLSATPGDRWIDYMPIFLANGFYRNKTDFINQHVIYDNFSTYPKIKEYRNESKLLYFRRKIEIRMRSDHKVRRHILYSPVDYPKDIYQECLGNRWDLYRNEPVTNPSRMTQVARRIVNESPERILKMTEFVQKFDKLIVFYNYNYELDILKLICEKLNKPYRQYNGHVHDPLPTGDNWCYLVHYSSSEGWNCINTNIVIFYSLNYSYKTIEQCMGRIDRVNTPYHDLYYYILMSRSSIDLSIKKAISLKKKFNEKEWGEHGE